MTEILKLLKRLLAVFLISLILWNVADAHSIKTLENIKNSWHPESTKTPIITGGNTMSLFDITSPDLKSDKSIKSSIISTFIPHYPVRKREIPSKLLFSQNHHQEQLQFADDIFPSMSEILDPDDDYDVDDADDDCDGCKNNFKNLIKFLPQKTTLMDKTLNSDDDDDGLQLMTNKIPSLINHGWLHYNNNRAGITKKNDRRFFGTQNPSDDDSNYKRNALVAFKREKMRSQQTQFIPSISVGAMTNLGNFFDKLKNNIDFMEKTRITSAEHQLLEGEHPIKSFRRELMTDPSLTKPTGTAAFLHAIRNYRPSQRVRALVDMTPEGYHGSHFIDPNYMWVGLGK